ncbi:MAG: YIP1 family protein [Candidatus Alcyoniella australis]|nr:YIP1 family protein [Candidatus Alcyoniella australis]
MSEQIVKCPSCTAQLNVGAPGRYRCPACGHEFQYTGEVQSQQPQPPRSSAYDIRFTPSAPQATPFERRDELGFVSGMFQTLKQTIVDPVGFFRSLDPNRPMGSALLYVVILGTIGYFFGVLWAFAQNMLMGSVGMGGATPPGMPDMGVFGMFQDPHFMRNYFLVMLIGTPIIGPLSVLMNAFITSAVLHLFMIIFRGRSQDFWATMRVYCYAGGLNIVQVVPFVGGFIAVIWMGVLYIIGLKQVHQTTYGKAVGAVLTPIGLLLVFCCVGTSLLVGGIMAASF